MSIAIQENQKLVTVKTPGNNSIHFRYVKGTKTLDDVFKVLLKEIKFNPSFGVDNMDIVCDDIPYNKIKKSLKTRDKRIMLDNSTNIKIVNKLTYSLIKEKAKSGKFKKKTTRLCTNSCCMNSDGTQKSRNGIFVKTLTGATIILPSVSTFNSIYEIKEHIDRTEVFPPDQQRLIFAGKQLADHMNPQDYDLVDGATIHIVLRLRGGMYTETSGRNGVYTPLPANTFFDLNTCEVIKIKDEEDEEDNDEKDEEAADEKDEEDDDEKDEEDDDEKDEEKN